MRVTSFIPGYLGPRRRVATKTDAGATTLGLQSNQAERGTEAHLPE